MPPGASKGGSRKEVRYFSDIKSAYTKKIMSSVEARMDMEEQIICVEQCTFKMSPVAFLGFQNAPKSLAAGALPQTPLGELMALAQTS